MRKNAKAANFLLSAVLACMVLMSMAAGARASGPSNQVTPGTVPGAPTGVTATPGNGQATVSFKLPANDTVPVTNCTVTSNPGGITVTDSGNPITVPGLTNGTAYTFTVKATNAVGTGPASSPSKPVTPATVPGAPTGVTAKAGNASAMVSFTAPASDGGSPITSYIVTSSPDGITATGSRSPIIVKGLAYSQGAARQVCR
ncbi:MAG: fibronectin type III domain-containing protein [Syntrophobacteraceae bacterium]